MRFFICLVACALLLHFKVDFDSFKVLLILALPLVIFQDVKEIVK